MADGAEPEDVRIQNIRSGYEVIARQVRIALRTQVGDTERLNLVRHDVLRFYNASMLVSIRNSGRE